MVDAMTIDVADPATLGSAVGTMIVVSLVLMVTGIVIVVAGADENAPAADAAEEMSLTERYAAHIAAGLDKKEAMRRTAQERGISRRDVYQAVLAEKLCDT